MCVCACPAWIGHELSGEEYNIDLIDSNAFVLESPPLEERITGFSSRSIPGTRRNRMLLESMSEARVQQDAITGHG